jgi:ketosteroid isomerase-like protein
MKKISFLLILIFSISVNAQNQEVQKTIETFFEAFHAQDMVKMRSVCDDKIIFHSVHENSKGNMLSDFLGKEFFEMISSIPNNMQFQEKILSYNIQIDGSLAHVWTPYEFYINGKLNYFGTNSFSLYKDNDVWKIIYVIDTRRK